MIRTPKKTIPENSENMYIINQDGHSVCLAETEELAQRLCDELNSRRSLDSDEYTVSFITMYHGNYKVYHDMIAEYDPTNDTVDIIRTSTRTPDSKYDFTVNIEESQLTRTRHMNAIGHEIYAYDIMGTDVQDMKQALYADIADIRKGRGQAS